VKLEKEIYRNGLWVIIDNIALRSLAFATNLVLARILVPEAFGVFALVVVFTTVANNLIDFGLSTSLLRSQKNDDTTYSTVFFVNVFISVLFSGLVFLISDLYESFQGVQGLGAIIRTYSIIFLIIGLSSVQRVVILRQLDYRKILFSKLPGSIGYPIMAIYMALNEYGVYSLVYGLLLSAVLETLMLWIISDWKPRFEFNLILLKQHLSFGTKMTISGLIYALITQLPKQIAGKKYGLTSLGFYERYETLNLYSFSVINTFISKFITPLLGQNSADKRNDLSIFTFIIFITVPFYLLLSINASSIIDVLLGTSWLQHVHVFRILNLVYLVKVITKYFSAKLVISGDSTIYLKFEFYKLVVVSFFLFFFYSLSFKLLVFALLISEVCILVTYYFLMKSLNWIVSEYFKSLLVVLLCSLFSSLSFFMPYVVDSLFGDLLIKFIFFMLLYFLCFRIFRNYFYF
jgi:O-antigen/teichoic acid export membrane protein